MSSTVENAPFRVSVIGISGSGKSTFAHNFAEKAGISYHELDLINWRANWYDRYVNEFEAFQADVMAAANEERWIFSGGYTRVRPIIFARAQYVVWLDLPFWRVLQQVFLRSLNRAFFKTDMLNGNKEKFSKWFSKTHPIQIVVRNYRRKQTAFEQSLSLEENAHLKVYRCRSRREIDMAFAELLKKSQD